MTRTGRPRKFERDEALAAAMELFWKHGFEGASLERLRQAMGSLSSASFYAAFTSKEVLYREAFARYLDIHGRVLGVLRDARLPPRDRIEQALRRSVQMQTDASHPSGCMVTLSATVGSTELDALKVLTAAERAANRDSFSTCVRAGIERGELRPDTNTAGLAALFEGLLLGFSIQAIDRVPTSALDGAITSALAAWDCCRVGARPDAADGDRVRCSPSSHRSAGSTSAPPAITP